MAKDGHLDTLRSLGSYANSQVEIEPDGVDARAEVAKIREELGKVLSK